MQMIYYLREYRAFGNFCEEQGYLSGFNSCREGTDKSEFMEVFRMKQKVSMICNIVSLILLIVFVIKSIVDYTQYSTSLNSAPFYLWVLVNALFLVIPAIILFVIGFVVKKKQ